MKCIFKHLNHPFRLRLLAHPLTFSYKSEFKAIDEEGLLRLLSAKNVLGQKADLAWLKVMICLRTEQAALYNTKEPWWLKLHTQTTSWQESPQVTVSQSWWKSYNTTLCAVGTGSAYMCIHIWVYIWQNKFLIKKINARPKLHTCHLQNHYTNLNTRPSSVFDHCTMQDSIHKENTGIWICTMSPYICVCHPKYGIHEWAIPQDGISRKMMDVDLSFLVQCMLDQCKYWREQTVSNLHICAHVHLLCWAMWYLTTCLQAIVLQTHAHIDVSHPKEQVLFELYLV